MITIATIQNQGVWKMNSEKQDGYGTQEILKSDKDYYKIFQEKKEAMTGLLIGTLMIVIKM